MNWELWDQVTSLEMSCSLMAVSADAEGFRFIAAPHGTIRSTHGRPLAVPIIIMVNQPVSMETNKHHGRLGEGLEERSGSSSDGCRTKTIYSERGAWRGRRWQADGGEVGRAKVLGEGRH